MTFNLTYLNLTLQMYSTFISMLHNSDNSKNKNNSVDNKIETNKEDNIVTPPVTEDIHAMLTSENLFKIVVIIIACLNKLHQAGNTDKMHFLLTL